MNKKQLEEIIFLKMWLGQGRKKADNLKLNNLFTK